MGVNDVIESVYLISHAVVNKYCIHPQHVYMYSVLVHSKMR